MVFEQAHEGHVRNAAGITMKDDGTIFVVCDDGTVWAKLNDTTPWVKHGEAVPGTRALG